MAGAGLGLIGGIAGLFGARKSNKALDQLLSQDPTYQANPEAAQRLGLMQTLLNARSPGAAAAERGIYNAQANTMANVNRNATDASQAISLAAASQGQANQQFGAQSQFENQDYQRRLGNYVGAEEGEIQEGDKVYQDQIRRFGDLAQIRGAQNQNRQSAWQSLSNLGFGAMGLGVAGGMKAMFPNYGQQGQGGYYYGTDGNPRPSSYKVPLAKTY